MACGGRAMNDWRGYSYLDSGETRRPTPGSQEWAETRGDDIPPLDEPGDDFDSELVITQDHTYDEDEEKEDYGWGI